MAPVRVARHGSIEVVRELRAGYGARTTLGVDGETGDHVVIRKLDLSVMRPWSWDWLTHELEVMANSRLPYHLTGTIARRSSDEAVLVRPFVSGRDILEWASHEPRPSIETHLQLMCDLLFALAQLHRMGIAHGGLKPANIILAEDRGELVLLDASITRTQLATTAHDLESGVYGLLPPVHTGHTHQPVGFAADVLAAGWVLLEALAESNRAASALRCDADGRDVSPRGLARVVDAGGVPEALRPIFLKLLSPLPDQRYESAEDALAAVEAVLATGIGQTGRKPQEGEDCGAPIAYVEPPLVGRSAELDTINSYVESASHPAGAVLCMSGESGVGKSRLLDAAREHADSVGVTVLRGGAFEYTAQRPLGLFAEPFRYIVTYLREHPAEADRVDMRMGELLGPTIELIPRLADAFPDQPASRFSGRIVTEGAAAAPSAIARLFEVMFSETHPGLLMVDDCQWADDLSWRVLAKIASRARPGAHQPMYLSLICSCRPEAVAQVRSWGFDGVDFLELRPLSPVDTENLVRSIGEHIPDQVVPFVIRHSGGNPLATLSVFRALIDSSVLTREAGRWTVDEDEMRSLPRMTSSRRSPGSEVGADGHPDAFVLARLGLLSAETHWAMRQGAVLGRQFSMRLLCCALGASSDEVRLLLHEGTERGILYRVAGIGEETFEFTHDRLREVVLRSLTEEERLDQHYRAAQALEASDEGQSDYEIAYHLERCGALNSAFPYALRAGEGGLRQHALDVAERNFEIAEAGLAHHPEATDRQTFRVYEGLGTVHMLLGSYDLAADKLTRAYEIATALAGLESARVATLLGELAFKTGRFEDAAGWMRQGMRDLGLGLPGGPVAAVCSSVADVGLLGLGRVFGWAHAADARTSERARLAARLHDRLVYEWWFVRSPLWLRWAILRCVRYAEAAGTTPERSRAYSMAAVIIAGTAPILAPVAVRLARHSLRMCRTANDDWDVAHAQHLLGFALLAANRYEQAIEAFDTAIAAFETVGDRWEQIACMWQKALCLLRQGKLHQAGVLGRETYREGKRIGDRTGAGTALAIWVRCLPGDVSVETISRELGQTNPGDHHTTAMLQAARGWRLFHSDQYEHALDAYRKADESIRKSGIRNHFVAPVVTSHLQVLRLWQDSAPAWRVGERRSRGKIGRRQLARALRVAAGFSSERPAVLREWAMMSFAHGNRLRGGILLRAATRSAAKVVASGDLAACSSVVEHAWIKVRRGALRRLSPADELCRLLGVQVDRGIVETVPSRAMPTGTEHSRHQALLDAVSSLVASEDVEEVLTKLRDATVATTTARRVEISRPAEGAGQTDLSSRPLSEAMPAGEVRDMKRTERIAKPVVSDGEDACSLVAAFPLGEGDHHEPTMEVLAALAGAVIERECLRGESIERIDEVQEAERGRIARDLHDEFGHVFASLTDGLRSLERAGGETTRQMTAYMRKIVRQGIQSARAVAWSLRPSGLDDLGLLGCIEQFVDDCRRIFPLRIELTSMGSAGLVSPPVETAIFRIVQEALTNAGKHSRATEVSVVLVFGGDSVRAVVEDDGIGFDLDVTRQNTSLGLFGMRERARLAGGWLTVDSQRGRGTTVMVKVPTRR